MIESTDNYSWCNFQQWKPLSVPNLYRTIQILKRWNKSPQRRPGNRIEKLSNGSVPAASLMSLITFTSLKKPVTATSLEGFVITTSPRRGCNTSCVRIVGESFFITRLDVRRSGTKGHPKRKSEQGKCFSCRSSSSRT